MELKYLLAYAPFNIKGLVGNTQRDLTAISIDSKFIFVTAYRGSRVKQMAGIEQFKPILRPLSDLRIVKVQIGEYFCTFSQHLQRMYPSEFIGLNPATWSYRVIEFLLGYHFDIFNLIPNGHAIDINTL